MKINFAKKVSPPTKRYSKLERPSPHIVKKVSYLWHVALQRQVISHSFGVLQQRKRPVFLWEMQISVPRGRQRQWSLSRGRRRKTTCVEDLKSRRVAGAPGASPSWKRIVDCLANKISTNKLSVKTSASPHGPKKQNSLKQIRTAPDPRQLRSKHSKEQAILQNSQRTTSVRRSEAELYSVVHKRFR